MPDVGGGEAAPGRRRARDAIAPFAARVARADRPPPDQPRGTALARGQSDPAFLAHLVANGRYLFERTLAVDGLPTPPPYRFGPNVASVPVPTLGAFGLGALMLMMIGAFARQLRARRR